MDSSERKFRVKSAIMGGGLSLREGEVVGEGQLKGYIEWLQRAGGIEEVREADLSSGQGSPRYRAYSA